MQPGAGFNLLGIPGDFSPPGRFVRLFYLKQLALLKNAPTNQTEGLALATALLNSVFIPKGAAPNGLFTDTTQYSVIKIPQTRQFYFKDYSSSQWKRLDVSKMALHPGAPLFSMPVTHGGFGDLDVTNAAKQK